MDNEQLECTITGQLVQGNEWFRKYTIYGQENVQRTENVQFMKKICIGTFAINGQYHHLTADTTAGYCFQLLPLAMAESNQP